MWFECGWCGVRGAVVGRVVVVWLCVVGVGLVVPVGAWAGFTRPFFRGIARAEEPVGKLCSEAEAAVSGSACLRPLGLAVEREVAGGEDDVWVGSRGLRDRFSPAYEAKAGEVPNHFVESVSGQVGAIERVTGRFYAGNVAVDNSPETDVGDMSHCTLAGCVRYVSTAGGSGGIEKLNAKEEPVAFECAPAECGYVGEGAVKGVRSKIIGVPAGTPGGCEFNASAATPGAVAVDALGDIYVVFADCKSVLEFQASGAYLQAFVLGAPGVPRLGPGEEVGEPDGVAVDAVSGHLLVSVGTLTAEGHFGAVFEFDLEAGLHEAPRFVDELSEAGEAGEGVALQQPRGVAVDSQGDVYVADEGQGVVDVWGPGAYYPTVTVGAVGIRPAGSAALAGVVDPAQHGNLTPARVTECYFQYVDEAAYQLALGKKEEEGFAHAEKAACEPPEIGTGLEEPHPVKATITHLTAGTAYRYRLVAVTDPARNGGTGHSPTLAFTPPAKPAVLSTTAGSITSAFVDLQAQIDPSGAATSYHFEYDTTAYSGEESHGVSIPSPDVAIGAGGATGSVVESVLQHIGPLTPGRTYHFRVVAENEEGVEYGPDVTFATLPAAVANERGYELVTPADKQGGSDMFAEAEVNGLFENIHNVGVPAQSGEGFMLETDSAFGEFPFAFGGAYVFSREAQLGRWSFTPLASRSLEVQTPETGGVLVDAGDLSRVAVNDVVGSTASEEGGRLTSLIGPPGAPRVCQGGLSLQQAVTEDCYISLHQDPPAHKPIDGFDTRFVGGSHDLEHVVLETSSNSVCPGPEDTAGKVKHGHLLCEWSGGYETREGEQHPELTLVNVNNEGEPVSECGAGLGNGTVTEDRGSSGSAFRAVSGDGSRVFFEAPDPSAINAGAGCWNGEPEELTGKKGVPVNAPQLYARIQTTGPLGETGHETIEISTPHEEGVPVPPASERFPAFYAGASEDGSRVFFATRTELTKETAALHLHDMELYEWRADGVAGPGGVCGESEGCLTRASAGMEGQPGREKGAGVTNMLAVAAEGSAVYFFAESALATGGTSSPEGLGEIYRYDTQTGVTSFVAATGEHHVNGQFGCPAKVAPPCSDGNWYTTPDGRYLLFDAPQGLERYDADASTSTLIAGPEAQFARSASTGPADGPVQAMSDNGEYVFFDTPEPLVPQATNNTLDTYEWHENPLTHEATMTLIGSGSDPAPTYFLGYAPYTLPSTTQIEGGNVFIGTHAKLTPQDTNSVANIYDARICQPESPCIPPPPATTKQCEGNTCQTPPTTPLFQTPPTLTPYRGGNLAPEAAAPPATGKTATQVRTEQLAKALKKCRKGTKRGRRVACERRARVKYAPRRTAKKSASGREK